MFGRAKGTLTLILGVLLLPAVSAVGGDKIQFSKPTGAKTDVAPTKDANTKNSPSLFNNFKQGGVDSLNFTPATPQAARPSEKINKEKDWIFATPEDGPTIEEVLKIEGNSSSERSSANDRFRNSISDYVEAAQAAAAKKELESQESQFDGAFSDLANRDVLDWRSREDALSTREQWNSDRSNALTDYFNDLKSPERERIEDMNLARRNEFQQIFQSRTTLPGVNGLDKGLNPLDAVRQPGTPAAQTVTAPSDLLSRTTQSSFSDSSTGTYEPLTATRSSALEDVNSRVLGREASSPLNTPQQSLRINPQPAVLPFPSRPGSLIQRP